ncbi:hypothetical protein C8034_v004132 [Colletotrichum sidae]|uniref:Uncharacterized protein n=1 Tax=Colletotrichum sidae TaxID=1347389 RepID=A0A4V3I2A4_9PEZI|nr:hypothetical protein C8034_v004132 [Colletotrichum sidae]
MKPHGQWAWESVVQPEDRIAGDLSRRVSRHQNKTESSAEQTRSSQREPLIDGDVTGRNKKQLKQTPDLKHDRPA